MEIKPLRTDEEIKDFIEKNYGSYENYWSRRNEVTPLPAPEAQPVYKSIADIFVDKCEEVAKSRGQTLAEFFARNPVDYEKYRTLVG